MLTSTKKLRKELDKILGAEAGVEQKFSFFNTEIRRLRDEIADLKKIREIEETKTKHYVKMREERQEVETAKKEVELEGVFQDKEMVMMKDYHGKIMESLKEYQTRLEKTYGEIMKRMPNVNWHIGDRGEEKKKK